MKLLAILKDFISTMWKFYSTGPLYVLYFFIAHMITLIPWYMEANGIIWCFRIFTLLSYVIMTISRYRLVKESEVEVEDVNESILF